MRHKLKNLIIILFLFQAINVCGQLKKNIKIYTSNENSIDSISKGIAIYFATGFDSIANLSIYFKGYKVKTIRCKTNSSIGYCVDSVNRVCNIFIPYNNISSGNILKIIRKGEYVKLKIPSNFRLYNRLIISRRNEWFASFERIVKPVILE